jgi:hypothetical protein
MSTVWRWILGVLAALIIIGVVAAAVFVWWNHSPLTLRGNAVLPQMNGTPAPGTPNGQQQRPGMPYGFDNNRRYHMGGWGLRGPMMGGRGFGRFGGFGAFGLGMIFLGGLLRLVIPLAILALVAVLFYQIGKRSGGSTNPPPSSPPSDKTPLPGRRVAKR